MKHSRVAMLAGIAAMLSGCFEGPGARIVATGANRREKFRNDHPEIVQERIAAAEAKRERKALLLITNHNNSLLGNYTRPWCPNPAHDKPTCEVCRFRIKEGLKVCGRDIPGMVKSA